MARYDLRAPKQIRPGVAARNVLAEQPYDLRAPKQVRPGVGLTQSQRNAAARKAHDVWTRSHLGDYTPKPPPTKGASNPSPAAPAAAAKAAAVASGQPDAATIVGNYNLERAKILQGMAPAIQGAYSQATKDLGGVVGGLTGDLQQRLFSAGGNGNTATTARGNDFIENDPNALARIAASYNAGPASNAAYNLGAAIPGESLAKQGAAFGAAAAFAPGAALQQGQYAVQAAVAEAAKIAAKAGASNSSLSRVNASASKLLGYLVDAQGQPITGKNGKPIKVPEQGLTPYQQATLGLSAARLGESARATDARLTQSQIAQQATDKRFYNGLMFKSAQQAQIARQKSETIDWTASGKAGVIINKDGSIRHDKHGRTLKFTKPAAAGAAGAPGSAASGRINSALEVMANGTPDTTRADGSVSKPGKQPLSYSQAIGRLVTTYNVPRAKAVALANQYYGKGQGGRPMVEAAELKVYRKNQIPQQYIAKIKANDPVAYSLVQGFGQENGWKLDQQDLALLRKQGVAEGVIKRAQGNKRLAFSLYAFLYEDDLRKQAAQANG